ncbi:MAG TPA: UDP-glucose 4-epimerase GalE [Chitinophagaceae bacterium]|nr:UDP-glucose 4-epimerase GalE [Chitinophagaceae bacterium]
MAKILVSGGGGYIGSHTIVDLIESGYDIISVDNHSRSSENMFKGIETISGVKVKNYKVDLCNFDDTFAIFQENPDLAGIIHFAGYKSVPESVEKPLIYFENNIGTLINLLKCVQEFNIPYFVFSSTCAVYGNPASMPVNEKAPLNSPTSPYGDSKQMCEKIIMEFAKTTTTTSCIILRYFNVAGAHPSARIGELIAGKPEFLVPAITQTAIGRLPKLVVHGDDYPTRDGTCIRDFIHVCDLARAHILGLEYLEAGRNKGKCEVYNLGTGKGITVKEAIQAFEKATDIKLNYEIGPRRPGDTEAIYADTSLAQKTLEWELMFSLEDIMSTAWKWEQRLKADETVFTSTPGELN